MNFERLFTHRAVRVGVTARVHAARHACAATAQDGFFAAACLALALTLLTPVPAHAWLGVLGKIGSAAGKAGTGAAGKGAAAGGAAIAGTEVANGVGAAGKAAAGAGGMADDAARASATSADEVSRASGLGATVPDEVRALMTPGKTLADVPDSGARAWLAAPRQQLTPLDANHLVRDYVALLEGKAAKGPVKAQTTTAHPVSRSAPKLPSDQPASGIPWYAVELLVRAAHLGHAGAQKEAQRLCAQSNQQPGGAPGTKPAQAPKTKHPACQTAPVRPVVAAK